MKKTKPTEYYGGRIKNLVEMVVKTIQARPELVDNLPLLHACLTSNLEGYSKRDKCFNCKRSMKISVYTADLLDALLLLAMAKEVKKNLTKGIAFTEANKVHLPTLKTTNGITKRNTKCDYLGFLKQSENWRGSGYWLLTTWAWKALGGEKVPKSVKYWEGNLIGRSEELTTLSDMFRLHGDLVQSQIALRKAVRSDYRADFQDYNPGDWSETGGYVQPEML